MGNKETKSDNKNEFDETMKITKKINNLIDNFYDELKIINNQDLMNKVNKYILEYLKFDGIRRFSIPVIGKINCGKSTILNYILNLDDILEYSCDITTKFISIIRHNKNLKGKKPNVYKVNFIQRSFINNTFLYEFEKDGDPLEGDAKEIIKKRNQEIINNELEALPENYFYIIETYIPLFLGEYQKYSNYFEFLDIPGLNESTSQNNKDNIYFEKIIPLFINNIKFSIFIFDTMNYLDKNNSDETFLNFEKQINSFYEIYGNENIKEKFKNSIFILNKIDQSNREGGLEEEKKDFKEHLRDKLQVTISDNYISFLSAEREYSSKKRFKSYDKYIDFVMKKAKKKVNFLEQLRNNMEKDFEIEIEENFEEGDETNEVKVLNESLKNEGFNDIITDVDYNYYKKYFDENIQKVKNNYSQNETIRYLKHAIKTIYENFVNFKTEKNQLYHDILNKLNLKDKEKANNSNTKIEVSLSVKNFFENKNYLKTLDYFGSIYEQLKELEPENEYIQKIYKDYLESKNYILNDYKYKIALFGGYSTGKSSLLNSLIGSDIIPVSSGLCTNIVLVIQYTKLEKDISLYSANFKKYNNKNSYYSFYQDKFITKGKEKVQLKLKELNEKYKVGEISYYILFSPIKFLDEFIEDEKIKSKIQFIDLPGLNTLIKEYEEDMLSNLVEYTDLFLYTNEMNLVFQKGNEEIIGKVLEFIISRKNYFNFNSIIFIVNFFDQLKISEESQIAKMMSNFKKDINKIIKKFKENNWNNYINNYSKIVNSDEDILCTYISPKMYNENQKFINNLKHDIKSFQNIIKKIIGNDAKLDSKKQILKLKKYIKSNYIDKLKNNSEFKEDNYKVDENEMKGYREELKIYLNLNADTFNDNKKSVDSIIIRYIFLLKNKNNFNYIFNDFIFKLKDKIIKEHASPFISNLFQLNMNLITSFNYISQNILRWKLNQEISDYSLDNISNIHTYYKKIINEKFKEKIAKLKTILKNIIDGKDETKLFNSEMNNLFLDIQNKYNIYIKKLKNEKDNINEKISLKLNDINGVLVVTFKDTLKNLKVVGISGTVANSILFGGMEFFSSLGLSHLTFLLGGLGGILTGVLFLIGATVYFGINKNINKKERKQLIEPNFNQIMNKITGYKFKINKLIDDIYNLSCQEIKYLEISQKKPMKNIIQHETMFNDIKLGFTNYLKSFNETSEAIETIGN